MNKIFMSQRLNARMQFKSLLMLSLLAGSASAQQGPMPKLGPMPTLGTALPCVDAVPAIDSVPFNEFAQTNESLRSTWTLRQHATWLLGLKPRQVMSVATEPCVTAIPRIDIVSSTVETTLLPAASFPESQLPQVPTEAVILVQHTEPAAQPLVPALFAATEAAAAVHADGKSDPVEPAHQVTTPSLNLRPVVSGPVPALPLEQLTDDSLLQVDLSGVDVGKLNPSEPESLIEGLGFTLPVSYSMNDNDSDHEQASLVASPAHAKPVSIHEGLAVSIHEGFAPKVSVANQAAQLSGDGTTRPADRLSVSGPGPSHFSMSDNVSASTSGAVLNRLSDKETVRASLGDRDVQPKNALVSKPVEKSFTDKTPVLTSLPVEVSSDNDRTSRSGKPVMLTPPSRLAHAAPLALPLSSALPIASTDASSESSRSTEPSTAQLKLPSQAQSLAANQLPPAKPEAEKTSTEKSRTENSSTEKSSTVMLGTEKLVSQAAPAEPKPSESLIDGVITTSSLLSAAEPVVAAAAPTLPQARSAAVEKTIGKSESKPGRTDSVVAKAPQAKSERVALSDFNPLAMKRPVVKAASVAIPEVSESDSVVVQSSHEVDDATRQLAEYAKMAVKMQQAVKQKFPNLRVKITCNEDGLIVSGNLANNGEASKVLSFVRKTSLCPVADRVTTSQ